MFLITKIPLFIGLSDNMYTGRSLPLFLPHICRAYMWGSSSHRRCLEDLYRNSLPDIGSRGDTMSPLILSLYYPNAVL